MDDKPGHYPLSVEIPVAWGDMDAYAHVNNAVYLRWFETGRIAYFERLGLVERKEEAGVGPILARVAVDYRRPVTYPDSVRVDTAVTRIGTSSFTMAHRVFSKALQAEAAACESVIVVYDYGKGRPAPVDDALRTAIAAIEGRSR
ncbi:MAG TPA: thioesterase family protein [Anaeromyxobacteraceae bacterium]|nr:thioesterase family protein [Anaeromyxobacteraceae bacterium]